MENNFLVTDEMLWDYADGFLDEAEKLQVEVYLQQHPEHHKRLEAIRAEKRVFAALPLDKPNAGFADRVMAAWVTEQAQARVPVVAPAKRRDWILISMAAVFGIFLVVTFLLVMGSAAESAPITIPDEYMPQLPAIDWATILGSSVLRYALLLIVALLSLQILDKYLQHRNRLDRMMPGL